MCYKAVDRCFFAFSFVPDHFKAQEMGDIVVPLCPLIILSCPDKMFDEAVDDCLAALKFILRLLALHSKFKKHKAPKKDK